ncbi:hypothetical protein DTO271D3_5032 [Paecilomyces variotii]|nr:hypothetical protein DTO271D3_5032 [Paecilomyces variotii]KAJ9392084.1 hypothetical protein DTO063F5_843 [Paecilomyces variotii]KAJ9404572.1 hypothetical protein DTO045G8_7645 [Paecilomyces variotii]
MAPHLNHDEFFSSLTNLLTTATQKSRGSVYLTQKRLPSNNSSSDDSSAPSQSSILIRATDGNTNAANPKSKTKSRGDAHPKVKLATVVAPEDIEAFYVRYAEVCKAGMVGMKKRDRSGKKKKGKAGKVAKA